LLKEEDDDVDRDDRLARWSGTGQPSGTACLLTVILAVVDTHDGSGGGRPREVGDGEDPSHDVFIIGRGEVAVNGSRDGFGDTPGMRNELLEESHWVRLDPT